MIQSIVCKCGNVFAACSEPSCYTDRVWLRELKKYVEEGCTVKMVEKQDFKFEGCKCITNTQTKLL